MTATTACGIAFFDRLGRIIGLDCIQEIGEGYALTITSLLVVTGWYVSHRSQMASNRKARSQEFISLLQTPDFVVSSNKLRSIYGRGKGSAPSEKDRAEAKECIDGMVGHAERTCAVIRIGYISEKYVILIEKTLLNSVFQLSISNVIESRRNGNNSYYENLEMFYIRNYFNVRSAWVTALAFITGSHLYKLSYIEFHVTYMLIRRSFGYPKSYLKAPHPELKQNIRIYRYTVRVMAVFVAAIWLGLPRFTG